MNKTYLVTGATSGIGLATCKSIIAKGDKVFAVGRDQSKIQTLLDASSADHIDFFSVDLNAENAIENLFEKISLNNIKLDGFVHCAGIEETIPLVLYTPEKVNRIFQTNVFTAIELIRLF